MPIYSHHDMVGQQIKINDVVAYVYSNRLSIGIVQKVNQVQITIISANTFRTKSYRYPYDILVITSPVSSMYVLKYA